jgi:hypothetical protein
VKGIEPSYEAWEASVLPLNYTRISTPILFGIHGASKRNSEIELNQT